MRSESQPVQGPPEVRDSIRIRARCSLLFSRTHWRPLRSSDEPKEEAAVTRAEQLGGTRRVADMQTSSHPRGVALGSRQGA